jgi:hypothetical protein
LAGLHFDFAGASRRVRPFVLEGRAEIPRFGVVHAFEAGGDAEVEDFAATGSSVAIVAEEAGERDDTGDVFVEVVFVVGDASRVGAEASEEGRAGGIAVGELAVGTFEENAALGESVEVGRFGEGVTVATEVGGEVVGHEEEDVGTGGVGRVRGSLNQRRGK